MASICGSPVCAGGKPKLKFTYTGDYVVREDGVVELLTSGTITFLNPAVIDIFCVGGGSGGNGDNKDYRAGGGGGAGGYTRTVRNISVAANASFNVTIGEGGKGSISLYAVGQAGGDTSFGNLAIANGGEAGYAYHSEYGNNGGSGGGGLTSSNSRGGTGGSNGGNGEQGGNDGAPGGSGQGVTTREFGEQTGKLYAGGGGGGRYLAGTTPITSMGGAGGGGTGAWIGGDTARQPAAAGVANTGGGGGGGVSYSSAVYEKGASGGSGIVCFREAQELPELAGTWVLNERLYRPNEVFTETINFEVSLDGTSFSPCTKATFELRALFLNIPNAGNLNVYSFNDSSWTRRYKYWKFTAGATASDEFRAWLASNAAKQA